MEIRHDISGMATVISSALFAVLLPQWCEGTATLNAGHENLLFVAAANGSTVYREQDNLAYDLDFSTSNGGINIVGVSLIPNTLGSATFTASAVNPTTVRVRLLAGTAAPADYNNAIGGTLNLSWSHDGVPGNANLNFELRAVDVGELVIFEGYTSTSLADSDITPITINGRPPFGASRYTWAGTPPAIPAGLSFSLVNHDGISVPNDRRWVRVEGGPAWTNQNTTFTIQFGNNPGNMANLPVLTYDLRLRSFSGVTIYKGQSLYTLQGPISAPGATPGGYTVATTVADGSSITLHPELGAVNTYSPASGWDTDTTMDVDVTDGDFCTTLTVRDVDVRFRDLKADGYTIFRGHVVGEGIINTSLPNDTYLVTQESGASAFPVITGATGTTPLLAFGNNGAISGLPTPPPTSQWAVDDTMNILIKDGSRPRSRVGRAVSFRELPDDLTYFDQQTSQTDATAPSPVGPYVIEALDPNWLNAPFGDPVLLPGSAPQPGFSGSGALQAYLNSGASPAAHSNFLVITNGPRPWSAGASIDFQLRHFASSGVKITAANPVVIPENGNFLVDTVDAGGSWTWSSATLSGFSGGSVSVASSPSPSGFFTAANVSGAGTLTFEVGPSSSSPDHPTVSVVLIATTEGAPIPAASAWGVVVMLFLILVSGTIIVHRRFETATRPRCPATPTWPHRCANRCHHAIEEWKLFQDSNRVGIRGPMRS